MNTSKENLVAEIERRVSERILEQSNADLLIKLINQADTLEEAVNIHALGTTYKRTGLHFDKRLEKMDENTNTIKFFKKNEKLSFHTDDNKPTHKLIIGDNYEALQNLLIQYKGKIDVIYIDPPYGKDYMGEFAQTNYQNAITRDNLLSMLYPRLQLAKQLLAQDGVIFCSIDDRNQAYIKCLMDEIFEERNFICNFCYLSSGQTYSVEDFDNKQVKVLGANLGVFKSGFEYVLTYRKTSEFRFSLKKSEKGTIENRLTKNGNNVSELSFPKGLKIRGVNNKVFTGTIGGDSEPIEILTSDGMIFKNGTLCNDVTLRSCFANPNMVRKFLAGETVIDNRNQRIIEIYFTPTGLPYMTKEKVGELPTNVLSGFGDTSKWREQLISILGNKYFDYPKPNTLISSLLELHANPASIILDFFAGSGTTGHAVLDLNRSETTEGNLLEEETPEGNRTFILVQMNEKTDTTPSGIAYDVTSKRLKRIMTGSCYDGSKDFRWLEKNKPYGGNLDVYEIGRVANFSWDEGKTPFDLIDETLYGKEKFHTIKEKIEWVCTNFERTQKELEANREWFVTQYGEEAFSEVENALREPETVSLDALETETEE